jgi:excisionase family DNA binding protein
MAAEAVSHRERRTRRAPAATAPVELDFMLLEDASTACATPIGTLRQWIADGRLPSYRPGRRVLVRRAELAAFIAGSRRGGTL